MSESAAYVPVGGDIGVVTGPGFVAWAIRMVTRAPVSHAFVYVGSGRVIEGWQSGVRYNDLSNFTGVIWLTNLSAGLSIQKRLAVVDYCARHLGTPYSWIDDAEIGFSDLFGWAPRWMRRRLRSDRTLMCSQLCDQAYQSAGVMLFKDGRPAGAVSPGDLWRANQAAAV
jgi:uncharacterized protein YycO